LREKKKGQFTIRQRKKKREIIEESHHQVNMPPDVGDEEKKLWSKLVTMQLQDGKNKNHLIFHF
jgi:hypothetical protein